MNARRPATGLCLSVLCLAAASPALGLANRVFASARTGNDANSCDNNATPCKTFAGAVLQLDPDGEAIVLDSKGYGPVTITKSVTRNNAGYATLTASPGGSSTTATYSTANSNTSSGWICGLSTTGKDVLNLELCSGSENGVDGLAGSSSNAQSVVRYSNCVFANSGRAGVQRQFTSTVESRGINTITGNGTPTSGKIGTSLPMQSSAAACRAGQTPAAA